MRRAPIAALYYASFAAVALLGLVQTKVLTRVLTPAAYGELQLVLPFAGVCLVVGGLGAPQLVIRYYHRDGVRIFWDVLPVAFGFSTLLGLALWVVVTSVGVGLSGLQLGWGLLCLFLASVLASQDYTLLKALLRAQERHLLYNAVVVGERVLAVVGVALLVELWVARPVHAYFAGSALGTGLLAALATWRARIGLPSRLWPGRDRLIELCIYGAPLVAVIVAGDLFGSATRYVIVAGGLGTDAVARYVLAYTISSLAFQALSEPLMTYLHPRVFRVWESGDRDAVARIVSRGALFYACAGCVLVALLVVMERLVIRTVARVDYYLPPGVFPMVVLAGYVMGFYRFASTHYYLRRNTTELALTFVLGLALNVGGAALLISSHGLLGVSVAALGSTVALSTFVWWRGRHTVPFRLA